MELQTTPHTQEPLLPVTFLQSLNRPSTPVPTLYAIRHFSQELESALNTLIQNQELQRIFGERNEEKNKVHERLKRIMYLFQEFLMNDARR